MYETAPEKKTILLSVAVESQFLSSVPVRFTNVVAIDGEAVRFEGCHATA